MWKAKLKLKGMSHEDLAEKLEITRKTMYKRFNDGMWKNHQKKTLKKLNLL